MIYFDNELRCFATSSDSKLNEQAERAKNRFRKGQTLKAIRSSLPQTEPGKTITGVKGFLKGRGYKHTQNADKMARAVSGIGTSTGFKKDHIVAASGVMGGAASALTEFEKRNRKYKKRKLLGFIPVKAQKPTLESRLQDAGYIIDKYRSGAATGMERSKKITRKIDD